MMNPPRQIRIDYESQGFPTGGSVTNGLDTLNTTWDELLWAAITVGRPNRQYVFRHGDASLYEALFRWSLTRMALEQRGPRGSRLRRTDAVKTLDPTEKGAVNYFLGMTMAKLFASRLLNAPWVVHLDVFGSQLGAVLRGRSRPDLIGQVQGSNLWIALEAKGRISAPDSNAKTKAKQQAQRVVSIGGTPPAFCVGAIMYFHNDVLQFLWRDPQPEPYGSSGFEVPYSDEIWGYYYGPVLELVRAYPHYLDQMFHEPVLMPLENQDIQIGIDRRVLTALSEHQWGRARHICSENADEFQDAGYCMDGIRVIAGDSWLYPQDERAQQNHGTESGEGR